MPRSPLPNMSVALLPPLVGVDPVEPVELVELELELLSLPPQAASSAPNAATAPVLPIAVRKRLRDAGSRSSSSSADRCCGRSSSCVIGLLRSYLELGRGRWRARW